jgi:hypothetical protein
MQDWSPVEFPRQFFRQLPPHIQSLHFYNCYGVKTKESYQLEKSFTENPSYYPLRVVSFVERNKVFKDEFLAPLQGLGHFIYKVDREIERLKVANQMTRLKSDSPVLTLNPKLCSVKLSSVEKNQRLMLLLNNNLIGLYKEGQTSLPFDCSLLKSQENSLKLYLQNIGNSKISWDVMRVEFEGEVSKVFEEKERTISTEKFGLYKF